jgi:hypothetical protein
MNQSETTLEVAGAKLTVKTESLFTAWMAQAIALPVTRPANDYNPPRIGNCWPGQGGIYAGIVCGGDGPDYHLIVGPAIDASTWDAAGKSAAQIEVEGHRDFTLPLRKEQSIQFANVPRLFEKEWYWSSEQHAAYSDYAWMQHFSDGYQDDYHKSNEYRARAVRRLSIIE